ncbi:MAG: hypothetical protein OEU26_20355 [Candidatus Tectomicrobia bacterium]|nr:hypothetical protein [Candidatus Tectomicrobia bacterium]
MSIDTIAAALDAATAQIIANWNFRTNAAHDPAAFVEGVDLYLTFRAQAMEKGGATAERLTFDHRTLKQIRDDAVKCDLVSATSAHGKTTYSDHHCYRD